MIYDEGRDANITRLSRLIERLGFMPLAGSGSGLRQPVHAEDLAVGALAAAASPAAVNKIYAVPGGDTITYREMVGRIFDGMHKRRRTVTVPRPLWRLAFAMARPFISDANVAMGNRMAKDMIFDPLRRCKILAGARAGFVQSSSRLRLVDALREKQRRLADLISFGSGNEKISGNRILDRELFIDDHKGQLDRSASRRLHDARWRQHFALLRPPLSRLGPFHLP